MSKKSNESILIISLGIFLLIILVCLFVSYLTGVNPYIILTLAFGWFTFTDITKSVSKSIEDEKVKPDKSFIDRINERHNK